MILRFKPHIIALACSMALCAAAGTLYVKSRQPVTPPENVAAPAPAPAGTNPAPIATPTFTSAQIDQWVAPVALYPDALLSQVLMASTYPANVVQAVQWSKDHPTLQGDAAINAVASQPWDASVKSLVAFPQLAALMGQDPGWVEDLGNAFLAQPQDVMDAVQKLRALAQQTGTLKSSPQQKVTSEPVAASPVSTESGNRTSVHTSSPTIIKIEPADPQVVYVPTYNPTTVYGAWPNTAWPPVYLPPPPGEQFTSSFVKGFGYSLGVATTYALFSSIDWDHDDHHHHHDDDDHHHHDDRGYHNGGYSHNGDNININVNNYNRITGEHLTNNNRVWQHNPAYRNGVPYVNNAHPVNVSGGLSATSSRSVNGQRQAALAQLQERAGHTAAPFNRDAQRQAASKQLQQIAQRNNYRGYDMNSASRDALRTQSSHPRSTAAPDRQRLNTATPGQRQQVRENVQQRLISATPEQRQQVTERVQQRRENNRASALSGNDSRSPSWQSQRSRGSESRRSEHNFSSEQRSAIRKRVAERRHH